MLRASGDTGHGIGTPLEKQIEELSDVYAFLLHELGVSFRAPASADVGAAARDERAPPGAK